MLKKQFSCQHLIKYESASPYIAFLGIALLVYQKDFRASIERCPFLACNHDILSLSGQAKVTDFDVILNTDKDIVGFQISVHFTWVKGY